MNNLSKYNLSINRLRNEFHEKEGGINTICVYIIEIPKCVL